MNHTKLFKSSDNFFNVKAILNPVIEGWNTFSITLNQHQALAFGITAEDKATLTNKKGEKIACEVSLDPKLHSGTVEIPSDVVQRFEVKEGEIVSVEIAHSSSMANDAIRKKMKWEEISYDEMFAIIKDISEWKLSEIMMTYYVASSFFFPTTDEEMYQTAKAMAENGVMFKYSKGEIVADKHSIWGVPWNETTMILIPLIASLGIKIPKNFSKSITSPAATGECVNVLMDINFKEEEIKKLIKDINCCLVWWWGLDLAPADDKLIKVQYPLAMQSRAKVVSSIMAKKYAMWVTHSLIDIPVWPTAKVTTMLEALDWKKKFEYVWKRLGMKMSVQITPAIEVIGNWVGATLQVREVLRVLQQHELRPLDLENKAVFLAAKLIENVGLVKWIWKHKKALELARKQLESGEAWKMMQKIIKAQHWNPDVSSEWLTLWTETFEVRAKKGWRIKTIDLHNVNQIARRLGCPMINEAGMYLHHKVWDIIKEGDIVYTMYANDKPKIELAKELENEKSAFVME